MDSNEIKNLFQSWIDKLREQDGSLHLPYRMALLFLSGFLSALGVDAAEFFDDKS